MERNVPLLKGRFGLARIGLIGFLILTLQIPILKVDSVIRERQYTKDAAVSEVAQIAGGSQTITGPILTVPYLTRWKDKEGKEQTTKYNAYLFPDQLSLRGNATLENRYRGIFRVPTYTASVDITGSFSPKLVAPDNVPPQDILWQDAKLSLGISDPRAIHQQISLAVDDQRVDFEPDVADASFLRKGIHAPVALTSLREKLPFALRLNTGGSTSLFFTPVGRNTTVDLTSSWRDPSFVGAYLPVERSIDKKGFHANWSIPDLGRGFARVWYSAEANQNALSESQFGVEFLSPVDGHRMTDRAMKYELLFIFLTFLCFYLFEIFNRLRIHPVQYLLIGAALVLFYLLLLSLSEHLGFAPAYAVATLLSVTLVTGYSRSVLRSGRRSWVIGSLLAILYGFLYTLLLEQDYALLLGSLGLTLALGVVMYITRNIDWYELSDRQSAAAEQAA